MSDRLYMISLHLAPGKLVKYAHEHDINRQGDEDFGYVTHAWLTAYFGQYSPKPFRLMEQKNGILNLLGYVQHQPDTIIDVTKRCATESIATVCNGISEKSFKAMPQNWKIGNQLGFEVLACPVIRKNGRERDVFLSRIEEDGNKNKLLRKDDVYCDWFAKQLESKVLLKRNNLAGFRLIRVMRKTHPSNREKRSVQYITRPQALFSGELIISDSEAFSSLIARGIGRHRSFGFGMILLRPFSR